MKYKIRDLQFDDEYYAKGKVFNSKKAICEELIDFHSIDCDMDSELDLLNKGKIDDCINALRQFEWEIEGA